MVKKEKLKVLQRLLLNDDDSVLILSRVLAVYCVWWLLVLPSLKCVFGIWKISGDLNDLESEF